ncbi:peptide chain release factor N(5)-glutamine methyltransferase [Bacteriovoracaceae bacterium]|nr:peptide chain release factor N(5)-glutamine methyltransferase [Bacteriovoracaceae bacterium]
MEENYPGIQILHLNDAFLNFILEGDFFKFVKEGIPLAYLTRSRFFWGREFYVDERVLIPRFETEGLVELILTELQKRDIKGELKIVDVGTGSGVILLTILQELGLDNIEAIFSDIDEGALDVCRENYHRQSKNIGNNIHCSFYLSDRLKEIDGNCDVIISNPPYIMESADLKSVHSQVLNFEPKKALFLKDEIYFNWYEDFFNEAFKCLNKNGLLFLEGHESHLDRLEVCLGKVGFSDRLILKDLTQRKRFLMARKLA